MELVPWCQKKCSSKVFSDVSPVLIAHSKSPERCILHLRSKTCTSATLASCPIWRNSPRWHSCRFGNARQQGASLELILLELASCIESFKKQMHHQCKMIRMYRLHIAIPPNQKQLASRVPGPQAPPSWLAMRGGLLELVSWCRKFKKGDAPASLPRCFAYIDCTLKELQDMQHAL